MLFVAGAFRQGPDLVAAIIEPALLRGGYFGRKRLTLELLIHKQVVVIAKGHLHQASAKLRNDRQFHPGIGQADGFPAQVVDIIHLACFRSGQSRKSECQE
jgi:hypothetical protein